MTGLDILLLLYLALGGLGGFRAGFVRSVVALAGLVGAWVVAGTLTGRLVAFVDARWQVVDRLAAMGAAVMGFPGGAPAADLSELILALPVPEAFRQALLEAVRQSSVAAGTQGGDAAGALHQLLALGLANLVGFVVLFVATRAAFALAGTALGAVVSIGPLALLNRLAGGAFGVLRNAAVASLLLGLLALAAALLDQPWLAALLERSQLAGHLLAAFYAYSPWLFR